MGWMEPLRDFSYINSRLIGSLARQLGLAVDQETTLEYETGVDLKLATGKRRVTKRNPPLGPHDPRLIGPIVEALRDRGQLHVYRPERSQDYLWDSLGDPTRVGYFVHEEFVATPVLVPRASSTNSDFTLPPLKVWVSDPLDEVRGQYYDFEFVGSFLFLVEETRPELPTFISSISGISALRMIVDFLAVGRSPTRDAIDELVVIEDKFGERSSMHPLDKLRSVGATITRPRHVEAVYRISYMNDEQAYIPKGFTRPARVNDVCAYPLYIAE
jgi:hypothetical protein